jgi:hypothetical protein
VVIKAISKVPSWNGYTVLHPEYLKWSEKMKSYNSDALVGVNNGYQTAKGSWSHMFR